MFEISIILISKLLFDAGVVTFLVTALLARFSNKFECVVAGACITVLLVGGAYYAETMRPYTITPAYTYESTEIENITSLADSSAWGITGRGSFILGTGSASINGGSRPVYVYYGVTPLGYQLRTIDSTNTYMSATYIREDENKFPYIECISLHRVSEKKMWTDTGEADHIRSGTDIVTKTISIIHVPNGTIYKQYSLDGNGV